MSYDSYMRGGAFEKAKKNVQLAVKILRKNKVKFSSIAVSGVSGLTFGSMLAFYMGKKLVVVRKTITKHSGYKILYSGPIGNYLFVDDLIDTGATFNRVVKNVRYTDPRAKLIGAYLYNDKEFRDTGSI